MKIMCDLPKSVKASIGFFCANVITYGMAYITTPLYTRLLSASEYGQVTLFLTCVSLFGVLAMFSLSAGVFNNGMVDYPDKRDEYTFSLLVLSNLCTIITTIFLIGFYPLYKRFLNLDLNLIMLMCMLFFVQPAYNFWVARQRYELKYKKTLFWALVCALTSPLVAIISILLFPMNKVYARLFGAELTLIIIYIGFYFNILQKANYHLNSTYWKEALLFNTPLIPHYFSQYILASSDKLMISYFINDIATAYYSVASSVTAVAIITWSAINATLIPFTYEKCKIKDYSSISKITEPIIIFFALFCFIVTLIAPEIVSVMATKNYLEAIYVIPPVIVGVFFQVQYFIYANIVYYYKKTKYIMVASFSATFLNLLLNFIFIPKFGYIAAGYTTLFSYIVQAVIDYFAMRSVVHDKIYNMKLILFVSVAIIIEGVFCSHVYKYDYLRYLSLICVLVIALFLKDYFLQNIRILKRH